MEQKVESNYTVVVLWEHKDGRKYGLVNAKTQQIEGYADTLPNALVLQRQLDAKYVETLSTLFPPPPQEQEIVANADNPDFPH